MRVLMGRVQVELMRAYVGYYKDVGCPFHAGISNADVAAHLERHEPAVYTKVFGERRPSFAAEALELMVSLASNIRGGGGRE
jgi:hypothetical protein